MWLPSSTIQLSLHPEKKAGLRWWIMGRGLAGCKEAWPLHVMINVMISLNHDEPWDIAQKTWALMILSQLKKWMWSIQTHTSTMCSWKPGLFLPNLLPQHLAHGLSDTPEHPQCARPWVNKADTSWLHDAYRLAEESRILPVITNVIAIMKGNIGDLLLVRRQKIAKDHHSHH